MKLVGDVSKAPSLGTRTASSSGKSGHYHFLQYADAADAAAYVNYRIPTDIDNSADTFSMRAYWETDAADSDTVLLLHMDSDFTDSSSSANDATATGATIDTGTKKFGDASGLFDGTGDYLSVGATADFSFGTGDFTFEGWFSNTNNYDPSNDSCLFDFRVDSSNYMTLIIQNITGPGTHTYQFNMVVGGSTLATFNSAVDPATHAGTWTHLAVVRSGSTFTLYVNGSADGTDTDSGAAPTSPGLNLGVRIPSGSPINDYQGSMDEVRVVKGRAVWTSNFTPPTAPYDTESINLDFEWETRTDNENLDIAPTNSSTETESTIGTSSRALNVVTVNHSAVPNLVGGELATFMARRDIDGTHDDLLDTARFIGFGIQYLTDEANNAAWS
jgi:hypothetical protein